MNTQQIVVLSEDVGTVEVVVSLSGPRVEETRVQLSISNNDSTGIAKILKRSGQTTLIKSEVQQPLLNYVCNHT